MLPRVQHPDSFDPIFRSVCGIVLVAIGSNLKVLADNCHTTATHIGTVFIVRGIGAVVGAVASAKLYVHVNLSHSLAPDFRHK